MIKHEDVHGIELVAQREPWCMNVQIVPFGFIDHQKFVVKLIEWEEVKESVFQPSTNSRFSLRDEASQKLMDMLWNCGLRPTEGTGSAGAMAATQKHLEDMRTLVFKADQLHKG